MSVKIATFNVENLFLRPKAMNQDTWAAGQPHLDAAAKLNALFNKQVYSAGDKAKMLSLLRDEGLLSTRPNGEWLLLREYRGDLFTLPKGQPPRIVATGRDSWVGWIEVKTDVIDDVAIENTARVIGEVNPDILVTVEVENRPALQKFFDQVVKPLGLSLANNMVIDGNDDRGIDVGVGSRFPIDFTRTHVTDGLPGNRIFSRDCAEFHIPVNGKNVVLLANHFASKGSDKTGARRRVQAQRVKEIYEGLSQSTDYVIVAGDLNDFPGGGSLDALLEETHLKDAMSHPAYAGAFPGTYKLASAKEKIDYLLLSPVLFDKVINVDVNRRGYWTAKWEHFDNLDDPEKRARFQASDHHCLWVELDL
jgi:endonuclease/exonuclease/phosphatase family metal-dependent hydrolase